MPRRVKIGFRSLRASLMLLVLICWLLPTIVLGGFMGARLSASLREKTEAAVIAGAKQAQTLLLNNVAQAVDLAKDATYDDTLSQACRSYREGETRYQEYFTVVRGYLDRKYSRERLFRFALFFAPDKPEEINYTSQAYTDAALFVQSAQREVIALCDTLDTRCRFWVKGDQAYLIRNLYNTRLERFAILVLGLDTDALLAPALTADPTGATRYFVALDDLNSGEQAPAGTLDALEERDGRLLYTQYSEDYDYSLLLQAQTDKHLAYAEEERLLRLMGWMIALTMPLCAGVMLYAQKRIVRPIGELSEASRRIENGELGISVRVRGVEELRQLGKAFSDMSARLKRLIDRSYKEQIALRDARIQAMQSRINPHFLNNALEDINWQARIDGNQTISEMVETLSVLLNAGIDRSERHLVPLQEELRIADAYFYFIGLRFGDRLRVEKRIDPDLADALVPRLVIQVLTENAVEHGIGPAGGGRITLLARREGARLLLEVRNDGKPLAPEELRRMQSLLSGQGETEGHIGIRNVNLRLELLFPGKAGLAFRQEPDGATVAAIHMPYTETAPDD